MTRELARSTRSKPPTRSLRAGVTAAQRRRRFARRRTQPAPQSRSCLSCTRVRKPRQEARRRRCQDEAPALSPASLRAHRRRHRRVRRRARQHRPARLQRVLADSEQRRDSGRRYTVARSCSLFSLPPRAVADNHIEVDVGRSHACGLQYNSSSYIAYAI